LVGIEAARCFPGPRERWRWRGKIGFAGTLLHGAEALAEAEEAGRKPIWGREEATPLGPLKAASAAT
jgi:hypothetical protein